MNRSVVMIALATAAAAVSFAPAALAARVHTFKATYTGHGAGEVTATAASGHASASGSGNVIGRSTLLGRATGCRSEPHLRRVQRQGDAERQRRLDRLGGARRTGLHVGHRRERRVLGNGDRDRWNAQVRRRARNALLHCVYAKETASVTISFKGRVTY